MNNAPTIGHLAVAARSGHPTPARLGGHFEPLEPRTHLSAPAVTRFAAAPFVVDIGGQTVLTADAVDADGIRGMTFFRDVDRNRAWSPGIDEDLGFVDSRGGDQRFQKGIVTAGSWSYDNWIATAPLDGRGIWGEPALISVYVDTAPNVVLATLSDLVVAPERTFGIQATVIDRSPLQRVLAFVDANGDRRYTPNIDLLAGEASAAAITTSPGPTGTLRFNAFIPCTARYGWPTGQRLYVDAVDIHGRRMSDESPARFTTQELVIHELPTLLGFAVTGSPGNGEYRFSGIAVGGYSGVRAVTIFQDQNDNGRWDGPAVDIDIGVILGEPQSGSLSFDRTLNVYWPEGRSDRFVATGVDYRSGGGGWGLPVSAQRRSTDAADALLTASTDPEYDPGAYVAVRVHYPLSPARWSGTVQPWLDVDGDGQITTGRDQPLDNPRQVLDRSGSYPEFGLPATVFGDSGNKALVITYRPSADAEPAVGAWSRLRIRGANVTQLTVNPPVVQRGGVFEVEFVSTAAALTRTAAGFIDVNRNDGFDQLADRQNTQVLYVAGNDQESRWRLRFDTTGLAAGTYSVWLASVDFENVWSYRQSVVIRIT